MISSFQFKLHSVARERMLLDKKELVNQHIVLKSNRMLPSLSNHTFTILNTIGHYLLFFSLPCSEELFLKVVVLLLMFR